MEKVYLLLEEVAYEQTTVLGIFSSYEKANEHRSKFTSEYPHYGIYEIKIDNPIIGNLYNYEKNL